MLLTLSYSGGSLASLSESLSFDFFSFGVTGSGRVFIPSGLWPGLKPSFSSFGKGAGGFFKILFIKRGRVLGFFPSDNATESF